MKFIFTIFCSVFGFGYNNIISAQCVSPSLKFANPVLVSGTALAAGAIYKFPDITAGIDCYIKLVKLNGGATLISMETPGQGYPDAWQPIINGPGTPVGNKSWIDWEISFKTTAGVSYNFPCLDISAIDVDGDNSTLGEFIESSGHTNVTVPNPTLLTITDMGNGKTEAQAPITNRPSIDTSAMDVRIGFLYNNNNIISLKLGSKVLQTGSASTQRLNCIYFKKIVLASYMILPNNSFMLTASVNKKAVDLSWGVEKEVYYKNFEIQRSFDGSSFYPLMSVPYVLSTNAEMDQYKANDQSTTLPSHEVLYYRLKWEEIGGRVGYSNVVAISLSKINYIMQGSPNPFTEKLLIDFNSSEKGKGTVTILNMNGQALVNYFVRIQKGNNKIQLANLDVLVKGIYLLQLEIGGTVINCQQIWKDY